MAVPFHARGALIKNELFSMKWKRQRQEREREKSLEIMWEGGVTEKF